MTTIQRSVDGHRGDLWLDRPDKLNPLGTDTLHEIADAARWFDDQPDVRVVVIGGRGRAFSAGADLGGVTGDGTATSARAAAEAGARMPAAIEAMRAIAIARIHGHCVGGAVVLAAACDLRVAAEGTQFSIPEVDLGIPLTWGGIPRLVREIGPAMTRDLVLTCRTFDADEALAMGLVTRVVPESDLDSEIDALATSLAAKAPIAVQSTKRHVDTVTEGMVGMARSWNDADSLVVAQRDPEGRAAAAAYVQRLSERGRSSSRP